MLVCCFFQLRLSLHVICELLIDFIYIHSCRHFLTVRGAENKLRKCKSNYYKARVYTLPKIKDPFLKIKCEKLNKAVKFLFNYYISGDSYINNQNK